jgi:enoyl-CoA hydratase
LVQHLDTVETAPAVRVLVMTAEGPTFCSGYDLKALGGAGEHGAAGAGTFPAMTDRLERLRVPTICALSGSVYGGGTDLALACDFRIGTPNVELRMTAALIGVQYYASGMGRFVARVGLGAAKRIFLTAEPLDAEELLRIGYLDELVPADELDARVDALASVLTRNAPGAVAGMKAALDMLAAGAADMDAIDRGFEASLRSPDVAEGLAARREKRDPVW